MEDTKELKIASPESRIRRCAQCGREVGYGRLCLKCQKKNEKTVSEKEYERMSEILMQKVKAGNLTLKEVSQKLKLVYGLWK